MWMQRWLVDGGGGGGGGDDGGGWGSRFAFPPVLSSLAPKINCECEFKGRIPRSACMVKWLTSLLALNLILHFHSIVMQFKNTSKWNVAFSFSDALFYVKSLSMWWFSSP